jgi:hypothetical protein
LLVVILPLVIAGLVLFIVFNAILGVAIALVGSLLLLESAKRGITKLFALPAL